MRNVRVLPGQVVHGIVANQSGVKSFVDSTAGDIGARAESRLSAHRRTGNASIEVENSVPSDVGNYGDLDAIVWLVDPAGNALSIEYGHVNHTSGEWVEGIHALRGAAGLLN